jgi:hypothetical protein
MPTLAEQLGAQNLVGRPPLQPGEPAADFAADFTLPTLGREGTVSLGDYRGRSGLLLALERGLYCAFCRRHIARLGTTARALKTLNVEILAVAATAEARHGVSSVQACTGPARRRCPRRGASSLRIAAVSGNARGPRRDQLHSGDRPRNASRATLVAGCHGGARKGRPLRLDRGHQEAWNSSQLQITGQFLIDRDGIVRWFNVEGARDGLAGLTRYPSDEELLEVARRFA